MPQPAAPSRETLVQQVVSCIDAGDTRGGLVACQQLNRHHPDHAYGWYLASFLMRRARNPRDALRAIERALALEPVDRYRLHHARCLFESGDLAATRAAVEPLRGSAFAEAPLHNELATLLHHLNEHADALHHYTRATALEAGNAEYHFNRAAVLRYLGEVDAAEAAFDRAIALSPRQYEACNARAQLRRQTPANNHVVQIERMIAATNDAAGRVQLHYALAKELEDLGEHARSFASLRAGADLKRRQMQYAVDTDLAIMAKIAEVFDARRLAAPSAGAAGDAPIFVIGMPRTGTTLVERILGSHSQVESAGELNDFAMQLTRLVRRDAAGAQLSRTAFVQHSAMLDFAALGAAYLQATRAARPLGRARFIDKLPFNFLYVGLIRLALPQSRIVSLRRHPVDTCYAVYKQLFRDAYPFSYDLDELAQYYAGYDRLMQHWDAALPGVVHSVRYEDLVEDLEREARRLLEYCGLPFEAACLRFHENPAASTTASATQVRQPIYRSSVGLWRNYAKELEPLRVRLRAAGIEAD